MSLSPEKSVVWDLPVRLFHWSLVLIFAGLWYTAEYGDLTDHMLLGKVMLGLLVFRLLWGIVGSQTARFSQLPLHPKSSLQYLKGTYGEPIGHNPLGSWSVVIILSLLSLQVMTGLFANDGVMDEGPLAQFITTDLSDELTDFHDLIFEALIIVLGAHITAVTYYQLVKKQPLIHAMISGKKALPEHIKAPVLAHSTVAVICLIFPVITALSIHYLL